MQSHGLDCSEIFCFRLIGCSVFLCSFHTRLGVKAVDLRSSTWLSAFCVADNVWFLGGSVFFVLQ